MVCYNVEHKEFRILCEYMCQRGQQGMKRCEQVSGLDLGLSCSYNCCSGHSAPRLFSPCGILSIRKLTSGQLKPIHLLTRASHPSTIVPPPMPYSRAYGITPKGFSL